MAKAKISWAIRHYAKRVAGGDFTLFMETHYRTRAELRKAWNEMPDLYRNGSFFRATRHRVTEWDKINKLSYTPVR